MLHSTHTIPRAISCYIMLLLLMILLVSCGGQKSLSRPQIYGKQTTDKSAEKQVEANNSGVSNEREPAQKQVSPLAVHQHEAEVPKNPEHTQIKSLALSADSLKDVSHDSVITTHHTDEKSYENYSRFYSGEVDTEDSASAVDDAIWRMLDLADEYHAMGVLANREASWEEAQYYFEKSLNIMSRMDIESDTILTPEAVKYTNLLDNIVADYRVTMRSLGQLQGDVAPSVLLERFGEVEKRLKSDSMVVFSQENRIISYDLPVKMNDRVKKSIIYFQTVAKKAFEKYLTRSDRYKRLLLDVLEENNLPSDLIYLSLVESGYNPHAYSWARASGLWQFISSTGRLYGLKRNWWIDERRDPVKSTKAAARFLGDLYKQFGDWELAMAAYNGGPGRVRRTIKKQKTIDFWKMRLKRQTMDYVPLIYAAAIIAKDPGKYGFSGIEKEPEIVWDIVTIDRCLDLKVVSRELGCSTQILKNLNPELLRNYTPPNSKSYELKIPVGSTDKFLAAYPTMPSPKETSWVKHKIKRGETISTIASRYGVSQYAIFESNNLKRRSRIYAGKTLIVPVPLDGDRASRKKKRNYQSEGSVYSVRAGDTMWDIARAFGTSVGDLRRVNYIERGSRIYVGQKLKLPSSAKKLKELNTSSRQKRYASTSKKNKTSNNNTADGINTHKVRSGDTIWDIARLYGTTTSNVRRLNGLGRSSRIYPGQILKVSGSSSPKFVIYKIRRGDTLGRIARKYRTTITKILAANHMTNPDNISVGAKLNIHVK